jgi:nucleoside-diphosphate-sugar epimerase
VSWRKVCAVVKRAIARPASGAYLDTTRLTHDTGFAPRFDVAAAVADYVAWRADNPR